MRLLSRSRGWWLAIAAIVGGAGLGGWYGLGHARPHATASAAQPVAFEGPSVEVVAPHRGGIPRVCLQPGSIEPYEAADLFTKVSGFLIEQHVDIGARVREGQVLARIAVPEYEKQVVQDRADVARAEAKVDQTKAAINTAQADLGAAAAAIALAKAEKKSKASFLAYREKQRDRIQDLVNRMAIDGKLLDEAESQYQAAVSADLAAEETIAAAKQKEASGRARVVQSQADLRFAEAEVASAKARLERSQVLVDYAVIKSPYDGVVTKRSFSRGAFIRAADSGGDRVPVLAVERTDIMRVVIQVPERDVPFVDCGDSAMIEVDALPNVVFKTQGNDKVEVSCFAASEDPHTRMMRTEVHVKNPDGKLKRGMFARVTLVLQPAATGALRIPSAALVGKAADGKGSIRVVRDHKAFLVPIRYGADNGSEIEVLSGLANDDRVIVRASGPINDGGAVTIAEKAASNGGH